MKKKILVVDDVSMNRDLLVTFLQPEGYELLEAESVKEARKLIRSQNPDLILLDVLMPEIDGFTFCQELKQNTRDFLPVILVTALNDRESRLRGLDCGADDFLSKPVDRLELLIKVRNMLKIRELNANLVAEVAFAGQVQENLFLANNKLGPKDRIYYRPCCRVGGDFLEVWEHGDSKWALLADASGHGPSAALIAVATKVLLKRNASSPKELLTDLNVKLCNLLEPSNLDSYVTAICFKIEQGTVTYANAGHPPAFLKDGQGVKALTSQAIPLGIRKDIDFPEQQLGFTAGAILLVYSDGVTEVLDEEIIQSFLESSHGSEEVYQKLINFLEENPSSDDVAFLTLALGS